MQRRQLVAAAKAAGDAEALAPKEAADAKEAADVAAAEEKERIAKEAAIATCWYLAMSSCVP